VKTFFEALEIGSLTENLHEVFNVLGRRRKKRKEKILGENLL